MFRIFLPALAWLDLQGIERRTRKVSQWIDRFFDSAIEKRMNVTGKEENKSKKDFLQYLLELTKRDSESASMTMKEIKAILIDIVMGGTETTSTTMEWVVARLLQHPEAMKRVQEEMDTLIRIPIVQITVLRSCHEGNTSFASPLPFCCPSQTSIVGGYTIPKGAQVMLNMWTIQRDPEIC
ncbi:hypothetical protein VNO80_10248 [Phaseolus coccineus]|uniref:Cytochrome P450 n=1 Tax=Phaseolus coccineus TaxID=3886 RepID=A0AAN9REH2_PHACN